LLGASAPGLGGIAGKGLSAIANKVAGLDPGVQNVISHMHAIGMTPIQVEAELARLGPHRTIADVDPALTTNAASLATKGGAPTSILERAMTNRAAGRNERDASAVNSTLGPAPDAEAIVGGATNRAVSNTVDTATAKAALDNTMGPAADPAAVLANMVKTRSAAAKPLYDKALGNRVVWDDRLQQFLDDPILQAGLAKGATIQRLESLADGTPFNPDDYVYKGREMAAPSAVPGSMNSGWGKYGSSPVEVCGPTPNMQTVNVVKKGPDAMVEDAEGP
jgi:hypothetical protein